MAITRVVEGGAAAGRFVCGAVYQTSCHFSCRFASQALPHGGDDGVMCLSVVRSACQSLPEALKPPLHVHDG
ncbi:MAG: hypothetical protein MK364_10255, partial [Pirellulales bacterium]|nr:hypothetical protein [Pirellulales bacterium]